MTKTFEFSVPLRPRQERKSDDYLFLTMAAYDVYQASRDGKTLTDYVKWITAAGKTRKQKIVKAARDNYDMTRVML